MSIVLKDRPESGRSKDEISPDERTLTTSGSDTEINGTPKPEPEPGANKEPSSVQVEEEQKWLEGLQLFAVLGSVTLVIFLMLLDLTIIATVSLPDLRGLTHVKLGWFS